MAEENAVGALAALFIVALVGFAMINIMQGADPNNTALVWFANRPDLFLGSIIFLVLVGAILQFASKL
ncbi:hypothetical protein [Halorussus sp. AFM4]|uniref:hypothetical protein n=1 Tax=Halorussus sp. AFM4 TaxID=3421651 RepID=UPI003EBB1060